MADAEFRAILLVILGGAYFFLVLPFRWFRIQHILGGKGLALFLGAVGVWFLAHLLLAAGEPRIEGLLVSSAAAIGLACLEMGRRHSRMASPPNGKAPPP